MLVPTVYVGAAYPFQDIRIVQIIFAMYLWEMNISYVKNIGTFPQHMDTWQMENQSRHGCRRHFVVKFPSLSIIGDKCLDTRQIKVCLYCFLRYIFVIVVQYGLPHSTFVLF